MSHHQLTESSFARYVGEAEANIRRLFAEAEEEEKRMGPNSGLHIIIFDEIDAICKARGSVAGGSGVNDTVVNQLLSKIDGVDQLNNILIIGMTNRRVLQNVNIASIPPVTRLTAMQNFASSLQEGHDRRCAPQAWPPGGACRDRAAQGERPLAGVYHMERWRRFVQASMDMKLKMILIDSEDSHDKDEGERQDGE